MTQPHADAVIRLFHASKRYGGQGALADVTVDVYSNERVLITGPSGAGKTTLLKLLYRGEPLTSGQILIDGMNLARIPRKRIPALRRKFGIIFQDYKLISTKTVFDNVALVLEAAGHRRRFIEKKVHHVLRMVGLEDRSLTLPPALSGGEQQRVAVARAVVGDPEFILADEPTGSLDPEAADIIIELLLRFHQRGGTLLIATHDRVLMEKVGGRQICLSHGRLVDILGEAPGHDDALL